MLPTETVMGSKKRIIIVGGVAAGATAAARARRIEAACEIALVERGPSISYAHCWLRVTSLAVGICRSMRLQRGRRSCRVTVAT